jgi:hypothetical protein
MPYKEKQQKYMYINNPNTKITLTTIEGFDKETNTYYRKKYAYDRVFNNEKELIEFLAENTKTNDSMDMARWDNPYIDRQNLCGTDVEYYRNEYGDVTNIQYKEYWFWTDDYKTIDVRVYKDKVYQRVYARLANLLPQKERIRYHYFSRPTSHTRGRYRSHVHYANYLRNNYAFEYEDENTYYKYQPKREDYEHNTYWADDFGTKVECGWKSHKYRKQWEHNVVMKETHENNKRKKEEKKLKK